MSTISSDCQEGFHETCAELGATVFQPVAPCQREGAQCGCPCHQNINPDRTVTVTMPTGAAYAGLLGVSRDRFPTEDAKDCRVRLKQALLDAGHPVDSERPQ